MELLQPFSCGMLDRWPFRTILYLPLQYCHHLVTSSLPTPMRQKLDRRSKAKHMAELLTVRSGATKPPDPRHAFSAVALELQFCVSCMEQTSRSLFRVNFGSRKVSQSTASLGNFADI